MAEHMTAPVIDEAGDFATVPVPAEERKSFTSILWVNAGYTINLGCIFGGAAIAALMPLKQAFIVLAISAIIQAAIAVPIGAIGAKYGLSSAMLSRKSYGKYGSWLIAATLAISLGVGWFGWQVALFADTVHALFPNSILTLRWLACIWGGGLMIFTATKGFKAMGVLSFIAVPMMITFFAFGTLSALVQSTIPFSELLARMPGGDIMTIAQGVTVAVGITVAGAIGMADITRYAKTPAQAGVSGTLGYLGGALFCECAGALIVVVSSNLFAAATDNLISAMLALGFGIGCLVMLILAQWTTNDNNLYSGALGLTSMIKMRKSVASFVMGAIGIAIAIAGIQNYFVPFLSVLGLLVPPMGGVLMSHYLLVVPLTKTAQNVDTIAGVNVIAIVSTVAAAALSYFWVTQMPASVIGVVASLILYVALTGIFNKAGIKYAFGKYQVGQ